VADPVRDDARDLPQIEPEGEDTIPIFQPLEEPERAAPQPEQPDGDYPARRALTAGMVSIGLVTLVAALASGLGSDEAGPKRPAAPAAASSAAVEQKAAAQPAASAPVPVVEPGASPRAAAAVPSPQPEPMQMAGPVRMDAPASQPTPLLPTATTPWAAVPSAAAAVQRRAAIKAPPSRAVLASGVAPGAQAYVSVSTLKCRGGPAEVTDVVRRLDRGTAVKVLALEGDWASIAHRQRQCWAAVRYLAAQQPW
jgi:hypothetical protein